MGKKMIGLALALLLLGSGREGWAGSEAAGEVLAAAIPVTALGVSALHGDRAGGCQLLATLATTAVATYGLNLAIDKETPEGDDDGAFPSGHSAISFAGAGFLHRRYGLRFGGPAYGAAALVGLSRIEADRHDLVDVLGGAALGVGAAFLLTDRLEAVTVSPWLDSRGAVAGVQVTTPWE